MEFRSAAMRFFRSWLTHWLTSVALTTLFVISLHQFSNDALFRMLDHLGEDAVVRAYSGEPRSSPSIVLVDLGPDASIDELAAVLTQIASANARSVGVDFIIGNLPRGQDGGVDKRIAGLATVLKAFPIPVTIPIKYPEIWDAIGALPHVREASVDLTADDDQVVRSTQRRICTDGHDGPKVTLPTLAAAMMEASGRTMGCEKITDARPILFAPVLPPMIDRQGIHEMSKENLVEYAALLKCAYVIVGVLGPAPGADRIVTPVGTYPGALVHAEALFTLLTPPGGSLWSLVPGDWLRVVVEFLVGMTSGALFAFLLAFRELGVRHDIRSSLGAFVRLAWGLGSLAVCAGFLFIIGVVWTEFAARLGVVLGAATAVFGAMLESLVHAADDLVGPLHWTMKRVVNRLFVLAAFVVFCAAPLTARAEECAYYIITISMDKPESDPPHAHPDGEALWRPFERVRVKANNTIIVRPAGGSHGEWMPFPPQQSGGVLVLPPCLPEGGFWGAWHSFWEALNLREETTVSGAALLYKGSDDPEQIAQRGPLREAPGLSSAAGVVLGTEGLALAWAGGAPPFSVTFADGGDGSVLGRAHTERRYLWLPGWRPPENPFVMTVQDSLGAVLRRELRLLPPTPIADSGVAQAIELYETAPEYRIEAFRRLAARSEAGDDLAEQAVKLIRVSGGAQ